MSSDPTLDSLVPSLREVVESNQLPLNFMVLPPEVTVGQRTFDRQKVLVGSPDKSAIWQAPKLSELFRGNRVPPKMDEVPEEYLSFLWRTETGVLQMAVLTGSRPTDKDMEEVYSNLRRRPDGRSLGIVHDMVWQVAAGWLGSRETSRGEFEAIFNRLTLSAATFRNGLVSRNYVAYINEMMQKMSEAEHGTVNRE